MWCTAPRLLRQLSLVASVTSRVALALNRFFFAAHTIGPGQFFFPSARPYLNVSSTISFQHSRIKKKPQELSPSSVVFFHNSCWLCSFLCSELHNVFFFFFFFFFWDLSTTNPWVACSNVSHLALLAYFPAPFPTVSSSSALLASFYHLLTWVFFSSSGYHFTYRFPPFSFIPSPWCDCLSSF